MPTTSIDVKDLPGRFSEVVAAAAAGEEVIVTENQVPRARLLPLGPAKGRVPGLHPGAFQVGEDFDAPLPDDFWAGTS